MIASYMKIISITTLLLAFCCGSIAQQKVKYLPSKIVYAGDTCKFEYDNLNRILRQKTITPQSDNIFRVESHFYTYSDTDNFTDKSESYLQSNDSIFDVNTELNKYEKHGFNFVCSKIKLSSPIEENPTDSIFEENLQIDSSGSVIKISSFLKETMSISTAFSYDSLLRIDNIKQEYTVQNIEEYNIMYLKYDTPDTNIGIFRDVNFTPITRIAQVGKPLFFIIVNDVPNEIFIWTSKNSKKLEQKRIENILDENGFPKSVITKDLEKGDIILISDIEYIKTEN